MAEVLGDEVLVREGQLKYQTYDISEGMLTIESQKPTGTLGESSFFKCEEGIGECVLLEKLFPVCEYWGAGGAIKGEEVYVCFHTLSALLWNEDGVEGM